jgi:hypothetical protein
MKTNKTFVFATSLLFILCSCGLKGIKIPQDKLNYVGLWRSSEIKLFIGSNGTVEYEKNRGNSNVTINAPIRKFEGNNFVVGALGINTTFVVSDPPHQDSSGVWKMTVDGNELTRTE